MPPRKRTGACGSPGSRLRKRVSDPTSSPPGEIAGLCQRYVDKLNKLERERLTKLAKCAGTDFKVVSLCSGSEIQHAYGTELCKAFSNERMAYRTVFACEANAMKQTFIQKVA